MNKERTEQIKIALLAIIAVLLIYQTATDNSGSSKPDKADISSAVVGTPNVPTISTAAPINVPPNPSPVPATPTTTMSFVEPNADLGSVKKGADNTHTFKVTNTGTIPLTFGNVTTDQGLVLVSKLSEPVPPGGTSEIVVKLGPDIELGTIQKTVHIASNSDPAHYHLTVKAVIEE